jgi:hypothetical protein
LKALRREIVDPAITAHKGRIVKTSGDEALAVLDLSMELNPSFAQAYFAQGFNCSGMGEKSNQKRCSIELPHSVLATAIFGLFTLSGLGLTFLLKSMR